MVTTRNLRPANSKVQSSRKDIVPQRVSIFLAAALNISMHGRIMTGPAELYRQNHRSQQLMLVGGVFAALVFGVGAKNERALFVIGGKAPKAFAAITSPPVGGLFDDSVGFSTPQRPARAIRLVRGGRNPVAPTGGAPTTPGGAAGPAVDLGGVPQNGPGAVNPPTQIASLGPPGSGPQGAPLTGAGPGSFGPATPATPTAPPTTTPVTPVTPVGPVPEPTTWAMMMLGFFGLGALLRRKRVAISSDQGACLQT